MLLQLGNFDDQLVGLNFNPHDMRADEAPVID
jgi:hypothetical protein